MNGKNQSGTHKLLRYLAVVLAGLLIVAAVWFGTRNFEKIKPTNETADTTASGNGSEDTAASHSTTASQETTPSESETSGDPTVSEADMMNVDRLIDRYYSAKINDNAEELNKIVDADTPYDESSLQEENQFIEKYDNFHTYVLPGLTDNYFVVYVRYDIFFNGISVGAPSLNHFIVAKADEDHFYIYDKAVSDEFRSYLETTEQSEFVTDLRHQVENDLEEACEKNADLKFLMQLLNGDTEESDASSSESTAETKKDETASESGDSRSGEEESTSEDGVSEDSSSENSSAVDDSGESSSSGDASDKGSSEQETTTEQESTSAQE
ncbi:MAG: hypothetical protein IJL98_10605 [Lachnospiraceae bacterium]|nr:hypothetical protein [Lachnospiraceae bacterium]